MGRGSTVTLASVSNRLIRLSLAVLAVGLAAPAAAAGAVHREAYFSAPINTKPYEAEQKYQLLGADGKKAPAAGGWITSMDSDVVSDPSPTARALPIQDVMIHHLVYGSYIHRNAPLSCGGRFYGRGEEHQKFRLPRGYGLPNRQADGKPPWWYLAHMLMNHRSTARKVYVRTRVTWQDEPPKREVDPLFIDAKKCAIDPVYDVPGGGRRGSLHRNNYNFRWPQGYSGRIIGASGHMHGGGRYVRLRNRSCRRNLVTSGAYYGMPNHEFYRVKPRLHEASPARMASRGTPTGIPVAAGQRIRLTAAYDNQRLHTRVMNIMGGFFVRDEKVKGCPRMPRDVVTINRPRRFRKVPPRYDVPIINKPPGPFQALGTEPVKVATPFFKPGRLSVRLGTRITWSFANSSREHSVTVTKGPRGFSSPWKQRGTFSYRPRKRGDYQIFCSLHPAGMTQELKVR